MIICTILLLSEGVTIFPSHGEKTRSDTGKRAGERQAELCGKHMVNGTLARIICLAPRGRSLRTAVSPARAGCGRRTEPQSIQPAKGLPLVFPTQKGLASGRLPFRKPTKQKGRLSFDSGKILFICCLFRKRTVHRF